MSDATNDETAILVKQVNELQARVERLERERWLGPPRIGPRPPSGEEVKAQTQKIVDAVKHEHETDRDGRQICTTSGEAPSKVRAEQTNETGQHAGYIVLCEEERQKGFVRPYRDAYKHATCGSVTTMGRALSETYARDPKFYSHTFCVHCNAHLPVAEFTWTADGSAVGS